jgi:patatin-like phospholipase/acyl hydrolase
LSILQVIQQLMERINPYKPPRPCEYFDMIGGTSTGGLIAIMLGRLRMDVASCIAAYTEMSDKIFRKQRHRVKNLKGELQSRFDTEALEQTIKDLIVKQGFDVDELMKDPEDIRGACKT